MNREEAIALAESVLSGQPEISFVDASRRLAEWVLDREKEIDVSFGEVDAMLEEVRRVVRLS